MFKDDVWILFFILRHLEQILGRTLRKDCPWFSKMELFLSNHMPQVTIKGRAHMFFGCFLYSHFFTNIHRVPMPLMWITCSVFFNQARKIKKMPQDQRLKQRPIDIPFKVWKELVKSYEKLDAQRKAGNESIQVLNFSLNII